MVDPAHMPGTIYNFRCSVYFLQFYDIFNNFQQFFIYFLNGHCLFVAMKWCFQTTFTLNNSRTNHREYCPYPSFIGHYKIGSNIMQRQIELYFPISSRGDWRIYFPFTCWKLWLARNERIFKNQSRSQHSLLYSSVQAATEFHFLAGTTSRPPSRIRQLIRWHAPPPLPYLKLNTDRSPLGNPRLAGAREVL